MSKSLVVSDIGQLVTLDENHGKESKVTGEKELGLIPQATIVIEAGAVSWLGSASDLPERFKSYPQYSAAHGVVTPGLIDCHTHVVYAGNRANEYSLRSMGKSYQEIAESGGGIKSTVRATRAATQAELYHNARSILERMLQAGTTIVEIKSGYGLETKTELKQLEVMQQLAQDLPLRIIPTFLGAHEIPEEFLNAQGKKNESGTKRYISYLIEEMLPAVKKQGIARFCDVFCEQGIFDASESRRILEAGCDFGLLPKLHAEELSYTGGSELASEIAAVSADHLAFITEDAIARMVEAGVVHVLLPGTMTFLGSGKFPPARTIINKGGRVALGTDCNPGSCTAESLPLIMTLAVSLMKMTPAEALMAVTKNAAYALRLEQEAGVIAEGRRADLTIFNCKDYQEIPYRFGVNQVRGVIIGGEVVV